MFDDLFDEIDQRDNEEIALSEDGGEILWNTVESPSDTPSLVDNSFDEVLVDMGGSVDTSFSVENFSHLENFVSETLAELNISGWFKEIISRFGTGISNQEIIQSVKEASDFFHIEEPMLIREDTTTGVFINDGLTPVDDVLVFSKEQLRDLGVTGKASLDLVMTHEGAHRVLQGMKTGFTSHQEELCCDYMAGVRAGLNNIDVSQLENSLSSAEVSVTHPDGSARVYAIEEGVDFAKSFMEENGVPPTFDDCLEHFKEIIANYDNALAFESHPFDEESDDFKGFVDDKEWHEKRAKEEFENANWHRKEAERATNRGDYSAAKDHIARANSCDSRGKDHMDSASRCSK